MTMKRIKPMPELPRPGQKVHWRDPQDARTSGWEDIFGPGPFEVVRTVDKSHQDLLAGIVLRTELGECEINEIWLALADAPRNGKSNRKQVVGRILESLAIGIAK